MKLFLTALLFTPIALSSCNQLQQEQIHITGQISNQATGLLGLNIKRRISIEFNGYETLNGYLDPQNNAELIGTYKDKPVSAKCGGAENVTCLITHNNTTTQITFDK